MHVPTHILAGWALGNCFALTPAERLCCMAAAAVPDVDGLGVVFGERAYQDWHHVAAHNLPFCVLSSAVLAAATPATWPRRGGRFALYVLAFHTHLVMDYYGSGPGWPIAYLWPLSRTAGRFVNWQAWELSSWQNTLAAGLLLAVTVAIAVRRKRTPLELLMPTLDAKLVGRPV